MRFGTIGERHWLLGASALLVLAGSCDDPATLAGGSARQHPVAPHTASDAAAPEPDADADADASSPPPEPNPIQLENRIPGTDAYRLTQPATQGEVEGYASLASAAAGDQVELHVNVTQATAVRWELYRLGYYQGYGGRLIATGDDVMVATQPSCPVDPDTGLIECAWSTAFSVPVRADYLSGYYLFKLVRADGPESYVPLIIREDVPRSPLLMQASVDTWQAYNVWGGTSLYANRLPAPAVYTGNRARRVSFDRPYAQGHGDGQMELAETSMVRWLEQRGYDVSYTTNIDVATDAALWAGRKMFLSVGHDEYWPVPERDALEAARDRGVSLGFFSANTGYWRVRLDASSAGTKNRVITCYKSRTLDPDQSDPRQVTAQYRDDPAPRPENALLGVMFELSVSAALDAFPLIVQNPEHWAYAGTGVVAGERLANVIGHEWDHVTNNGLSPAGLEIVGASPAFTGLGFVSPSNATLYYPSASSLVFAAGAIYWSWGLGMPGYTDARVQRLTDNVLARAGVPSPLGPTPVERTPPSDVGNAQRVSLIAGSGEPGDTDGPAAQARFNAPAGVALAPDGSLYVTEARNHRVRRIGADGLVSTLAGCGPSDATLGGKSDGAGSAACFSVPTGIAVRADGVLFVSDTDNHRIVSITPQGDVTTYLTASYPRGLAFGPDGKLYFADSSANVIGVVDPAGALGTVASGLNEPTGVAVDENGVVYAIDTADGTIWKVENGVLGLLANQSQLNGDQIGPAPDARLRPAEGAVVDGTDLVFSDSANYRIRNLSLTGSRITTLAGDGNQGLRLGTGASAQIAVPRGLCKYKNGYAIADSANNRVLYVER